MVEGLFWSMQKAMTAFFLKTKYASYIAHAQSSAAHTLGGLRSSNLKGPGKKKLGAVKGSATKKAGPSLSKKYNNNFL